MKAKRKREYYKSTDAWLDAVYRNNKARIDFEMPNVKNKKASFKNAVKGYIEEDGLSPEKSLEALENSTIFTPESIKFAKNVVEGLKSNKMYSQFKKMVRTKEGKFANIELQSFKYDREQGAYMYYSPNGTIIVIQISNSPEEIIMEFL